MEIKDEIKIIGKGGFVYYVTIKHYPLIGLSIAYLKDLRIASREYGRMLPPMSDDDKEWEEWEERFKGLGDAAISDLQLDCQEYFNRLG